MYLQKEHIEISAEQFLERFNQDSCSYEWWTNFELMKLDINKVFRFFSNQEKKKFVIDYLSEEHNQMN